MRRLCLALLATCLLCAPAAACLWDRDTNLKEQQFRSDYQTPGPVTSTPAPQYLGGALMGGGAVLFAGAGLVMWRSGKKG